MNLLDILMPILAGLIGGALGIYLHGRMTKNVKILLAFSGAYLLALSVLHLLPEIYQSLGRQAGYFILVGFLLQILMDFFSKGVEHGHIHASDRESKVFPLGIYVSLFIHSAIEGMPLADSIEIDHVHHSHHEALLTGIVVHKVPEAIALAALLYHFFESKARVFLYIFIYTLATPIGMLVGSWVLSNSSANPEYVYGAVLAVAVGIFLHVATTIIFEAEEHHKLSWKKMAAIIAGLLLVLLM